MDSWTGLYYRNGAYCITLHSYRSQFANSSTRTDSKFEVVSLTCVRTTERTIGMLRPLRSIPRQRSAYERSHRSPQFAFFRFNSTSGVSPATPLSSPHRATPKHRLAIVGGGLGGLSSAFYFLQNLSPRLRETVEVVIFEKDDKRTGGWCRSVIVNSERGEKLVTETGGKGEGKEVVFETGPRSIRPVGLSGWLTVEMVRFSVPFLLSESR